MSRRITTAVVVALAAVALSGCVYYNTFYHARAAAREVELLRESRAPDARPGTRETELLDRIVEKCGRVLQLHPDSEWADDALLLLGTAHYYQGRYESAEDRLNEFLAEYPDSRLRPEAEYMLASVLLAEGNPVSAETLLKPTAYAEPPEEFSDEALALIGRALHARKKYDEAAETYLFALDRFPRGSNRAELRYLTAQSHEEAGDLDEAARHYALVPSEPGARKLAFESRMRLAEVDLKRGRPDEALTVLDELSRRTDDRDELDRVLLLTGSALEASGDLESAVSTYEGIAASHKRSEASAEAFYRIGLIQRDEYELLDAASASFKSAKDEAPRSEVAGPATDSVRDIERLKQFLAVIAEHERAAADTASAPKLPGPGTALADSSTADAALADSSAVGARSRAQDTEPSSLDTEPSALDTESSALDTEPSALDTGPSALDAEPSALDTESSALDTEPSALDAEPSALDTEPSALDTEPSALDAEPSASDTAVVAGPEDEVAKARFRIAELYLFRFDDPARARGYYASVVEEHSESELAPKAALALAWILESRLDDPEGARQAYSALLKSHPDTDYGAAAAKALARLEVDGRSE